MQDPLEMNFYGTRNEASSENAEITSEKNGSTGSEHQFDEKQELNKHLIQDDGTSQNFKKDGIGKWMNLEKGIRRNTDPYPNISYLRKYYSCKDKNLPKQLQELFTPLKCNLCNCAMGSTVTAKDHYDGKKHNRNIKKWLLEHPEYCKNVGIDEYLEPQKIPDNDRLYCKYWDVKLSSEQKAQSHSLDGKHQNIINSGIVENAYINPTKREWEQFSKSSAEGQFGIGVAFLKKGANGREMPVNQKFFCEICQVPCPSEITFSEHLGGSKHKKKMVLLSRPEYSRATKDNILEEVIKNEKKIPSASDLSIYRTPSGKYYCHGCNVTVNSPIQFLQHSESKKHKNKAILASSKCASK